MEHILKDLLEMVAQEYLDASGKFPAFHSAHEGYAVILEEMDELKAEVWKNPTNRDSSRMFREAVQVAAMALRFIIDLCPLEDEWKHR